MRRHKGLSVIIGLVFGLAAIGLASTLINNPGSLFMSLLIAAGLVVLLLWLMRRFLGVQGPKTMSQEDIRYKKAVQQSKRKYQTASRNNGRRDTKKPKAFKLNQKPSSSRKSARPTHLRVIEGKKRENMPKKTFVNSDLRGFFRENLLFCR
ncbi:hypothetical protein G4V62_00915 [Bacillaceae bacterium SIJ1]|uniref:SA1362 family protein n=1 Tax=Litoribacterium kuwaitense TaxID=1398745 RepID=UPI0013EC8BB2|nr:SA1362 family protein [Litoribacterium kuwaitense]NGP43590.1 hypothetical protein [Litoribacterium kuwaitense]